MREMPADLGDAVEQAERVACAACVAVHHADCWAENGACASCGSPDVLQQGGARGLDAVGGAPDGPAQPIAAAASAPP